MSADRALRDAADRARARDDLRTSLMVEAGAGTGKTTVLLDRVTELLKTTVPLERIAIITFTEKAAGELKIKLRRAMETMIRKAPGPGSWPDHLRRSLESLDRATVTTIHSFAASLLRERPVEAQVDPRFAVADELTADMLRESVWQRWIEREMTAGALPLARALRLGLNRKQLRLLAWRIADQRDVTLAPPPAPWPGLEAARDQLAARVEALRALTGSCIEPGDRALAQIERLLSSLPRLREQSGDRLMLGLEDLGIVRRCGTKSAWRPAADLARAGAIFEQMADEVDEALHRARTDLAHELGPWIRDGFVAACQQEKAARRLLDFNDLLITCRDMLRDSAAARAAFQERFDCLLVDEFQDTDPLQAEIVFLLASDDPAQSDWRRARPRPGKLFVVGDPKQSIYRFRRADIEIYDEVKGLVRAAAGDAAPPMPRLMENFRTVPSIAAWVNELCTRMFPRSDRRWQPDFEPLSAFREEPDTEGRRVVLLVPGASGAEEADTASRRRAREAAAVTALLHTAAGAWPVTDDGRARPARWGDMALLFRTGTATEAYEDALREARVPYRLTGGRRYYLRAEMRALQSVLEAIERPHDPLAVVSALRGAFFGFSDEDLLAHAALKREWLFTRAGAGRGTPFEKAFELLARLHAARNNRPVAATIEELFDTTGILSLFYLKPDGEQRAANLIKSLDLARAHDATGAGTFGSFTRWLEEMASNRDDEEAPVTEDAEPGPAEDGEGVVRLMTVHKAKGLEFPLVVLCDPAGGARSGSPTWIVERGGTGDARLRFCVGHEGRRFATAGYDEAAAREKERLEAESHRLLYVAATRARDWLVAPLFGEAARDGWLKVLADQGFVPGPGAVTHRGARVVDASTLAEPLRDARPFRMPIEEAGPRDPVFVAEREAWRQALRSALDAPATGRAFRSPTKPAEAGAPASAGPGERAARALGIAVHAVLERIDLATGRDIGVLCEEEAGAAGRPDLAPEVRRLVERALAAPIVKEALAAPRLWRELPFVLAGDTFVSEGRCDLVFESGGGITIVDFKTDAVFSSEEVDARAERHRFQALVYARAVSQIAGLPVTRVVLLFVRPDVERAFRVDEGFLRQGKLLLESPLSGREEGAGERAG